VCHSQSLIDVIRADDHVDAEHFFGFDIGVIGDHLPLAVDTPFIPRHVGAAKFTLGSEATDPVLPFFDTGLDLRWGGCKIRLPCVAEEHHTRS